MSKFKSDLPDAVKNRLEGVGAEIADTREQERKMMLAMLEAKKKIIGESGETVNHPVHYNTGKIEVIEFLEDQKLEPHEWNAVKYICRARHKGKLIEDLKKAVWYLQRKLEILQAADKGREPVRPNDMNSRLPSAPEFADTMPARHGEVPNSTEVVSLETLHARPCYREGNTQYHCFREREPVCTCQRKSRST